MPLLPPSRAMHRHPMGLARLANHTVSALIIRYHSSSVLIMLPSSLMLLHDCCFRPLARKAMQMPPSEEDPSKFATSSLNPAWRRSQPSQAHHGTNQSYHPTASSFAASAANTAAALGSTFREASTVLHEAHSQVLLYFMWRHALFKACICSMQTHSHAVTGLDMLIDIINDIITDMHWQTAWGEM